MLTFEIWKQFFIQIGIIIFLSRGEIVFFHVEKKITPHI